MSDLARYSSGNGFLVSIWGPPMWHFLHTMSFNYPVHPTAKDQKNYKSFIKYLGKVLPCGKCRENFKKNIAKLPLKDKDLKNRDAFSRWIFRFHNEVNKATGKHAEPSYEAIRERYEFYRAKCSKKKPRTSKYEAGCVDPANHVKSKCVLAILPQTEPVPSLVIHPECQ